MPSFTFCPIQHLLMLLRMNLHQPTMGTGLLKEARQQFVSRIGPLVDGQQKEVADGMLPYGPGVELSHPVPEHRVEIVHACFIHIPQDLDRVLPRQASQH